MTKAELLEHIKKLQYRWKFHAIEHREKRENGSPSYDAYQHGITTGFLKALNSFSDWTRRLEMGEDAGWISVKDRLPEEGHFVLTCVSDTGTPQCVGMALLLKDGTWWDGDIKVNVDYWMEVPKLPKEEENETK